MFQWFKKLIPKYHNFEVGDEIIEDCESWERPKSYRVLEVGKKRYKLMDLSGFNDPYRSPDQYIQTDSIYVTDLRYLKKK